MKLSIEQIADYFGIGQPPSGGCVLKLKHGYAGLVVFVTSRLQAAVC